MSQDETPVREIMSSPVRTITADTTVCEAANVLADEHIGSLVVCGDIIQGIITETDIVRLVGSERELTDTLVSEVMSEPVVTVRPHEAVRTAGERMGHNNVRKLPVTEQGEPVGVVTTTDLAHFFPRSRILMASDTERDVHEGEFE
jgi:CBS domain-containing protein